MSKTYNVRKGVIYNYDPSPKTLAPVLFEKRKPQISNVELKAVLKNPKMYKNQISTKSNV